MLAFDILLVVTAIVGMLAVVAWIRVASNRSVNEAFRLDGAEKLAERANRRAFNLALIATAMTVVSAGAAFLVT